MGGIVIKSRTLFSPNKPHTSPHRHLPLPLELLSSTFSTTHHPPDPDPNDTMKNKFFKEHAKILSSKTFGNIHPELRRLRLLLGCDYGRPKLIQFLTRTTPITSLLDHDEHLFHSLADHSFVFDHFIAHFDLPEEYHHHPPHSKSSPHAAAVAHVSLVTVNLELFVSEIVALAAIANYQNFLLSSEHSDWVKYQQMVEDPRNGSNSSYLSESLRSLSKHSSHRLAMGINQSDFGKLLSNSHWIVVLAHLLEEIPFPVSIVGKGKEVNAISRTPLTSTVSGRFHSPLFLPASAINESASPESISILFGNSAFVDMVGETREDIAQHRFDYYHHPHSHDHQSSATLHSDPELTQAIHDGTSIKIGTMYHPLSPLAPFMNLQSYLPLYDPQGHCNYFLVLHCDIWKHHQNPEYLQKLDIFTELLSKTIIPYRDHGDIFLKAYFYNLDDKGHRMKPHPSHRQPPNTSSEWYRRSGDQSATVDAFHSQSGPVDPLKLLNTQHEE
jgi:hypothetical protein